MFRYYAILLVLSVTCIGYGQSDIIISQYIETTWSFSLVFLT